MYYINVLYKCTKLPRGRLEIGEKLKIPDWWWGAQCCLLMKLFVALATCCSFRSISDLSSYRCMCIHNQHASSRAGKRHGRGHSRRRRLGVLVSVSITADYIKRNKGRKEIQEKKLRKLLHISIYNINHSNGSSCPSVLSEKRLSHVVFVLVLLLNNSISVHHHGSSSSVSQYLIQWGLKRKPRKQGQRM